MGEVQTPPREDGCILWCEPLAYWKSAPHPNQERATGADVLDTIRAGHSELLRLGGFGSLGNSRGTVTVARHREGDLAFGVDELRITKRRRHGAGAGSGGVVRGVDRARAALASTRLLPPTLTATTLASLLAVLALAAGVGRVLEVVVGQAERSEAAHEAQLLLVRHTLARVAPLLRLPVEEVRVAEDPGLAVVVGLDHREHPAALVDHGLADRHLLAELVSTFLRRRPEGHRHHDPVVAALARHQERVQEGRRVVEDAHRAVGVLPAEVPQETVAEDIEERNDPAIREDGHPVELRRLERASVRGDLETGSDARRVRVLLRFVLPREVHALVVADDPGLRLRGAERVNEVHVLEVRTALVVDVDVQHEVVAGVGVLEDHRSDLRTLAGHGERQVDRVGGESTLPAGAEADHDLTPLTELDRLEDDRVAGTGLCLRLLHLENLLSDLTDT